MSLATKKMAQTFAEGHNIDNDEAPDLFSRESEYLLLG